MVFSCILGNIELLLGSIDKKLKESSSFYFSPSSLSSFIESLEFYMEDDFYNFLPWGRYSLLYYLYS